MKNDRKSPDSKAGVAAARPSKSRKLSARRPTRQDDRNTGSLLRRVTALAADVSPGAEFQAQLSRLVAKALPHDLLHLLRLDGSGWRGAESNGHVNGAGHPVAARICQAAGIALDAGEATSAPGGESKETILAAPILEAGRCLAALVLSRSKGPAFSEDESRMADHIAAAIAPAFGKSDAASHTASPGSDAWPVPASDLERGAEISQGLAAIGRILSSSLNIGDVYQAFADHLARLIKFDRLTLSHVDARSDTVTRAFVSGAQVPGITQGSTKPYSNSTEHAVIEARRPLLLSVGELEKHRRSESAQSWHETGFRSLLSAPMYSQGVGVGTIGMSSFAADAFTAADAELLGRVADQIAGTVANARLHTRMSREAAEREGIARIGRVVGESLDLTTVCNRLAEEVRKLVPYDRLIVTQVDEERHEIFDFYSSGVDVPGRPDNQSYPLDGTLTHAASLLGAPIRIDVETTDPDELIRKYPSMASGIRLGFKSFIAVPLRVESKSIGSINLRSFGAGVYTDAHGRLLEGVAAQVAPAIRNAELHHQIQEAAGERLALAEIGRMVGSAHDFSDIHEALVDQIGHLIPADRVSITVQEDDDTGRVVLASGVRPDFRPVGTTFALAGTVSGWVLEHGRSFISGINAGKALLREVARLPDELKAGFHSVLSTPLMEAGEIVGVLHLRTEAPDRYEPRHAAVAERIATQIAGSVANLGLREALEREISVSNALSEISRTVNSVPDIRIVFDDVAERIRDLTGADRISVSLVDLEERRAVHFAVWGRQVGDRVPGWSSPLGGSLARWLAEHRSPLLVNDQNLHDVVEQLPQLMDQDLASGLNSMLSVPLLVGDVVRGALHLRAVAHNAFDDREAVLAERIAAQIAGAILNSEYTIDARRTAEERLALTRIGQLASSSLDFGTVFPQLADRLSELLPTERIVVAEFDEKSEKFTDRYIWGRTVDGSEVGSSYRMSQSVAGEAFRSRSPLSWNRAELEKIAASAKPATGRQQKLLDAGFKSAMIIPLIWQDRAYGVLSLRTEKDNAYRQRELALARQVGAQIVGAVVVSSLYSETRRIADDRLALSEIGRLVSSSLDFGNIFPEFARRVSALLPADRVVVAEFDAASETFTDRHIWGVQSPGDEDGASYPLGSSLLHGTFKSGNPAAWSKQDIAEVSKTRPDDVARIESGLQSVMTVPLIWQDWIFGVLNVRSKLEDPYGERELELARQVGGQIAGAVAVSTLYTQTRRVADERTALSEIGRLVSSSLDFSKVFDQLGEKIAELIPADRIVISTFEEPTRTYIDRFVWGTPVEGSRPGMRHAPGQSLSYLEEGNREPTVRTRKQLEGFIGKVPGVAERFEAGLYSVLRVPLIWEDRIFGELNVRSKLDDPYTPAVVDVAKEIGAQIVGAVAVSTLYEEATRTSQERLALSEIGRIVSSVLEFSEAYPDITAQLRRLVPFDRLVLSIYDEADESFVDRYVWGEQVSTNPPGARHKLDTAYVRDAFLEGRSIARNKAELEKLAEFSPGAAEGLRRGLVSALSVPMSWQSRIFGMLNLRSKLRDAYGPHEVEVAEHAAAQIAGGFASAFRYEQTVREAEVRRALAAMSLAAGSDHRLDKIFDGVESELKKIIPYDRIVVTLAEPDSEKLRLVYVRGIEVAGHSEGTLVGLLRGEAAWKWEASILPNDPVEGGAMERAGLHSWVQVPLGNPSSAPIGYLSLRKAGRDFYRESDKTILEQVSTYITPGVQNAMAHQREIELARQRDRATQLEQQARELERVNQAKSEFFSAVSHELRTPLTSVVAFTDIIARNREETLSERDIKHLQIIRRNASHLKVLINDLLDVSQIESGRLELILRPVDLGRLLRDAADSISPAFEGKRQELVADIPRRRLQVDADPDRITQVVSNLLANANKFSPGDSKIELRLESRDGFAVISVIDHGPGVPPAEHTHLFTPFFRVDDPATRDVEGTGLGLAISKQLVDLHKGTIEVQNTPGGGATFVVRIPLSND